MQIICTEYQQNILCEALTGCGIICPAEALGVEVEDLPEICRMSCEECLKDRLDWRIEE